MAESLFGHLALTFGPHPENLATEALAFILTRSPAARAAVRSLLEQFGATGVPEHVTWATQATGDDDARPDLVARDGRGGQPIVIEAKFDAGLTEHQPTTYLARPGLRVLMIVAPSQRGAHLWNELRYRCEAKGIGFSDAAQRAGDTRCADVGNQRQLVLVSWRTLLAAMLARVEGDQDHLTARDIAQLQGLCERMERELFVPVRADELTTTVYRRVVEFGQIVDDIVTQLVHAGVATTTRVRSSKGTAGTDDTSGWVASAAC